MKKNKQKLQYTNTIFVIFTIFLLAFLALSALYLRSQQSLKTKSEATELVADKSFSLNSIQEHACLREQGLTWPSCVYGFGGSDYVEGSVSCARRFEINCRNGARRVIPFEYASYCKLDGEAKIKCSGVPENQCLEGDPCNADTLALVAKFCGCPTNVSCPRGQNCLPIVPTIVK